MRFEKKWVLSVACGKNQEPLLKAAKAQGYSIIGVDQSPSSDLVDIPIPLSTHATEEVLSELRDGDHPKFEGVLCRSSGPAVVTANAIAEAYSLPNIGNLVSKCSVSKWFLHDYLNKLGICTIPTILVESTGPKPDDWTKVVVKPSQSQFGKKNVYLISDDGDYRTLLEAASAESTDGRALIQPFVTGLDIGLVTLSRNGLLVWYTFFQEHNGWHGGVVDAKGVSSLEKPLSNQQETNVIASSQKVIADSRSTGFIFFAFRVSDHQIPMLYEINPGLCGDLVAETLLPSLWPKTNFFEIDVLTMTGANCMPPRSQPRGAKINHGILLQF